MTLSKQELLAKAAARPLTLDDLPAEAQAQFRLALAKQGVQIEDEVAVSQFVHEQKRKAVLERSLLSPWRQGYYDERVNRFIQARPEQLAPTDVPWFVWLLLAGRGFGKTRTGAEWLYEESMKLPAGSQVLLCGRTPADVRDFALYGEGGLLTNHPDVIYIAHQTRLIFPNGVEGVVRSGAVADATRGFSGSKAWLDELFAWQYAEVCWNTLIFGIRAAGAQILITTTPRVTRLLKQIRAMPKTVVVKGRTDDNRENLDPTYMEVVVDPLKGTRLGRQENDAEELEDIEGALWTLANIEANRVYLEDGFAVPPLRRIVVGVDPQGKKLIDTNDDRAMQKLAMKGGGPADEDEAFSRVTGIVVAGLHCPGPGIPEHGYLLADRSINGKPHEWGAAVVRAYKEWGADMIVAEINFGGDMVSDTIHKIDPNVPVEIITASRGKIQRAEPISTLYENNRVHHVCPSREYAHYAALESEMTEFTGGDRKVSPNRLDAMVWAMTKLFEQAEHKPTRATFGRRLGKRLGGAPLPRLEEPKPKTDDRKGGGIWRRRLRRY